MKRMMGILSMTLVMAAAGENRLFSGPWRTAAAGGSRLTAAFDATGCVLERFGETGSAIFLPRKDFPIVPGKSYAAVVRFQSLTPDAAAAVMVQTNDRTRRPFPTSGYRSFADGPGEVSVTLTARPTENTLRLMIPMRVPGRIRVLKVELREVRPPEPLKTLNCTGAELKRHFRTVQGLREYASDFPDAEVRAFSGGFRCSELAVPTAEVKVVEAEFRAFGQGGALRMDCIVEADGRTHRSFFTASVVPDGEFHLVRFPVAKDPFWKGTLRELKFSWQSLKAPGRISLASVRGLADSNVLAGAERVLSLRKMKAEFFRPRGVYRFTRRAGRTAPEFQLTFLDRKGRRIARETLRSGEAERRFTVPELMVSAELTAHGPGEGVPLVELLEVPPLDRSPLDWRGSWIWSRSGEGPLHEYVYFAREFDLEEAPAEAFFAGTGDDALNVEINGTQLEVTRQWSEPRRLDIARYLKRGRNRIVLEVYNIGAWGGALADIWIRERSGRERFILTDGKWLCREGKTGAIDRPAQVIGPVPAMPWGNRLCYCYAGPRGKLRLTPVRELTWRAEVLEAPPVDLDRFDVTVALPDGSSAAAVARVTPSSGSWRPGKPVEIALTLPGFDAPVAGKGRVRFNTPLLECDGAAADFTVPARRETPFSTLKISGAGTRPYFVIDGVKRFPFYFVLPAWFILQPERMEYLVRNAVKAGCPAVRLTFGPRQGGCPAPGVYDFSALDRALRAIAAAAPELKVILAVPGYMPDWFMRRHPDESTAFYGGEKPVRGDDFHSIASRKYLEVMTEFYARLRTHLANSSHAGRVVGLEPTDGTTSEWLWSHGRGHKTRVYSDWSPAALAAYREYLRGVYGGDPARLAAAWQRPGLDFDRALPPLPERMDQASVGDLLDPGRDRDLIDWSNFRNECLSRVFLTLCALGKAAGNGGWAAGSYYGYLNMLSWMQNYLSDGGHMRIAQVAGSPHADFVIGPTLYHWRTLGNGDGLMQPAESFTCRGKPVIAELDLRTFTEPNEYEARNGRASTVEHSAAMLDRAFGMLAARGCGGHWLEMYDRWFREPVILEQMRGFAELYMSLPERPAGTVPREVAVVSDQYSTAYVRTNKSNGPHVMLVAELMRRMPETGFGFNHLLKDDLLTPGTVPPQKFYIVTNLFMLDAADRRALLARFARERATVLWLYLPGVSCPDRGPDAALASELLGIRLKLETGRRSLRMDFVDPSAWGVRTAECYSALDPWLYPESGFDEVLARTPDGRPALVRWRRNGVTNYFCMLPNPPPELLRKIAAASGVHSWSDSGDPVWAGNDFVTLHARTGGVKRIILPPGTVARSVLGPDLGTLTDGKFTAEPGRTYGFIIEKR